MRTGRRIRGWTAHWEGRTTPYPPLQWLLPCMDRETVAAYSGFWAAQRVASSDTLRRPRFAAPQLPRDSRRQESARVAVRVASLRLGQVMREGGEPVP